MYSPQWAPWPYTVYYLQGGEATPDVPVNQRLEEAARDEEGGPNLQFKSSNPADETALQELPPSVRKLCQVVPAKRPRYAIVNPRRKDIRRSWSRSVKRKRTPSAFATSWPITRPPSAGEMTKPLRSAEILGNTLTFFQSVDAVGKQFEMMPLPGCGKGDPPQFIHTGVGGPHLRARARVLGAGGS